MTTLNFQTYLGLRKTADKASLTVRQVLDLTREAQADGIELDFSPLPGAEPTVIPVVGKPTFEGYSNRKVKDILSVWVRKLASGAVFTRDEAIRKALLMEPRDRILAAHPSRAGALTVVTRILNAQPGVKMTLNEHGHSAFADPEFTFMKAI